MLLKLRCDAVGLNKAVDFFKSDSVAKVRAKAAELTDIDADKLRMIANGKVLVDKREDGSDAGIYLDFSLKGGEVVIIQEKPAVVQMLNSPPSSKENSKESIKEKKPQTQKKNKKSTSPPSRLRLPKNVEEVAEPKPEETAEEEAWGSCEKCTKNPARKCKECNCRVCGINKDSATTLICDGYDITGLCEAPYHLACLTGKYKLDAMPEKDQDWYCPECADEFRDREEKTVMPNKGVKLSEKKAKMPAAKATRAWGGGVSCAGVEKKNTAVTTDHKGPIPGVHVGQTWQYRVDLSSSGIHRPPVAGIHASERKGAMSIVMSGGYGDDADRGDEFEYTGSGGRDLSGNKRTSAQSKDQTLEKANLGLAKSCYAFNEKMKERGGDAGANWKKSTPIRVVRGVSKAKTKKRNNSKDEHDPDFFMPEQGFRYDGIYKIAKFFKAKGKEGFAVWKFLMRRDDDSPAPWTDEGKRRIKELGLTMIMGSAHEEMKQQDVEVDDDAPSKSNSKKKSKKRGIEHEHVPTKRMKIKSWVLPRVVLDAMAADQRNKSRWDASVAMVAEGRAAFFKAVEEHFTCVVCLELYKEPVTLLCGHNLCESCLKRCTNDPSDSYKCPTCRNPHPMSECEVNEELQRALKLVHDTNLV